VSRLSVWTGRAIGTVAVPNGVLLLAGPDPEVITVSDGQLYLVRVGG
jgi:hypothetical protein